MNIQIANRLCELRKKNNLSQEQLAEKIGVSRQAVSKWERGEASPDTDNLISLAEIYNVSIDEILTGKANVNTKEEQSDSGGSQNSSETDNEFNTSYNSNSHEGYTKSSVSFKNGIHVDDNDDHVHIGFDGIHVEDKDGTKVHIDKNGVFVEENGETKAYTDENGNVYYKEGVKHCNHKDKIPLPLAIIKDAFLPVLAVIVFLILGFCFNYWYIAWVTFLAIPIVASIIEAFVNKKVSKFCYPVLVVMVYLILGMVCNLWHPAWIIFLTIPVFYGVCSVFENR